VHFAIEIKNKYIVFRKTQRTACKGSKSRMWLAIRNPVLYKFIASKSIQSDMNYVLKNTQSHRAARAPMDETEWSASERSRENTYQERYCFIHVTCNM